MGVMVCIKGLEDQSIFYLPFWIQYNVSIY